MKRKVYSEGLEQIENTPEIAPAGDDILGATGFISTPSSVDQNPVYLGSPKPTPKVSKAKPTPTPGALKKRITSGEW